MEMTVLTNKWPIDKQEFDDLLNKKMNTSMLQYIKEFNTLTDEIQILCKMHNQLKIVNMNCYINIALNCVLPDFDTYTFSTIDNVTDFDFESFLNDKVLLKGVTSELPTLKQLKAIKSLLLDYFAEDTFFVCVCDDKRYSSYLELKCAYKPRTDVLTTNVRSNAEIIVFPVCNLFFANPIDLLMYNFLTFGMCPEGLSDRSKELMCDLSILKKHNGGYVIYDGGGKITMEGGRLLKDLISMPEDEEFHKLHWQLTDLLKHCYKEKSIGEVTMDIDTKEVLLNCEKIRADIEPYEERILTDPNRGHWDLWRNQSSEDYTVQINEEYMARNPECDINENGVIAIDFGTKSTIVVYQSDINHSLPMGIGDGNLSKAPTVKRYENPTVMHFVNIDKFLSDYNEREGRPKTEWNDLTISHTAMEQFSASSSEEYYEYLHQIKQWAGQREKQFRIQPHEGKSIVLPSFLDLKEDDINPIELYAYYIGLYINNMRKGHGIFLDYYLSFPVTYEVRIREKIVKSFEKGLKKSLPITILNNPELMSRFHVNGDISEPAAYAVCALQEYGFDPKDDEEFFYGIFDFGGGTTDFDFGLWRQSSKRKYDYTIENFGAGGDEFLGGENLLEMLAFEVFKKNQDLMREHGYTFTLAPKCKEFLGSDALLSDSQEAEKNMHNLMEILRPYWEKDVSKKDTNDSWFENYVNEIRTKSAKNAYYDEIETELDEIEQDYLNNEIDINEAMGKIAEIQSEYNIEYDFSVSEDTKLVVTLFDRDGKDHANETLEFSVTEINSFIEAKIREGVNNFFSALLLSYQNDKVKKPTVVNILLAGNSCKSPVVRKVFEEEIEKRQQEIKDKYNVDGSVGKLFEIFPPLGTTEAYEKMKERKIDFEEDNFEKPTGKTGVAFGLLQCRKGGKIERISNINTESEIPFQFFIGWESRKKFVLFRDDTKATKYKGKPDYNIWYKFIEADDDVFELYYTTLPECVNGDLLVDGNAAVKRHRCNISIINEDAFVYIRAIDPHTIEYVVAENDNVEHSKLGNICRKVLG